MNSIQPRPIERKDLISEIFGSSYVFPLRFECTSNDLKGLGPIHFNYVFSRGGTRFSPEQEIVGVAI